MILFITNTKKYLILFFVLLFCCLNFITCKESDNEQSDNTPQEQGTQIEFNNLEDFLVTIYSDAARQNIFTTVEKNSSKKIAAVPNITGVVFYPTFSIDVPYVQNAFIPHNAPEIITVIEKDKTTQVPITKLETIQINNAYFRIENNSDFSLSFQYGNNELSPLGGRPNIIVPNQSAVYEINPGNVSGFSLRRNTTIPIAFPAGFTEFEAGNLYSFTFSNNNLVLSSVLSLPASSFPSVPKNLTIEIVSATSVKLTWEPVIGAVSYRIYKDSTLVTTVTTSSYTITSLEAGTNYNYNVKAFANSTEGQASQVRFSMPPANIKMTNRTNTAITIAWDTVTSASGYNIYRSDTENGTYTKLNETIVTVNSYLDNDLSVETYYYYKVAAVISNILSLESIPVPITTLSNVPDNLLIISMKSESIAFEWDLINNANGYNIYRSDSLNGIYTKLNSDLVLNNNYLDSGVLSYTTYYYKVTSIISGVESDYSEILSGSTGIIVPGSSLSAKLTWLKNNALSNSFYTIEVSADENISPQDLTYSGKSNINIVLSSLGNTINLSSNGMLFTIGSGITLTLNNITLNGRTNNNDSLVRINDNGTLILNEGVKISGNSIIKSYESAFGGGVYLNGGTIIMNGGQITGNSVSSSSGSLSSYYSRGGGIYIGSGVFTLNAGEISGNNAHGTSSSAYAHGGGVYIANGTFNMNGGDIFGNSCSSITSSNNVAAGIYITSGSVRFRMSGGVVYGNNAPAGFKNTANNGSALYCASSGIAQYGNLNNGTFYRTGDFGTSINTTIRVVDGNLLTE